MQRKETFCHATLSRYQAQSKLAPAQLIFDQISSTNLNTQHNERSNFLWAPRIKIKNSKSTTPLHTAFDVLLSCG